MRTRHRQAPAKHSREVTVSSNRQVGLPADFARAMGVKPNARLTGTLVKIPGDGYAVILMPKSTTYTEGLRGALTGAFPEGGDAFVRNLRREWDRTK